MVCRSIIYYSAVGMAIVTVNLSCEYIPWNTALGILTLYLYLALLCFSYFAFDDLLRHAFFFESDFYEDVDIMVQCLLESREITEKLNEKQFNKQEGAMEVQELRRIESLIRDMGRYMTSPVEDHIEAPLEQDILRFSVLQSIGGGVDTATATSPYLSIPKRQREMIQKHVGGVHPLNSSSRHLRALLLVRGLCVFAGGVGEALHISCEKRIFRLTEEQWKLPPGAIVELLYAIRAITRIFRIVSISSPLVTSTQLAILLPSVMSTIFRIRGGICAAAERSKVPNVQIDPTILPCLQDVVDECDRAAALIFSSQHIALERVAQLPLDKDIVEWLQSCCVALL